MSINSMLPRSGSGRGRGYLGSRELATSLCGLIGVFSCLLSLGACSPGESERPGAPFSNANLTPEVISALDAARAALGEGDYRRALATMDSLNRIDPEIPDAWYLRGLILSEVNDADSAQAAFLRAVELDPDFRGAYFQVGQVEFKLGRYARAIQYYMDELQLIEQSSRRAKRFYRERDRAAVPALYMYTGRAYQKMARTDSARVAFERSIGLDSLNATVHTWLAELYADTGEFAKALQASQRAVWLDPRSPEHRALYGSLLVREKRFAEALPYLESAIHERPADVHTLYNYNLALTNLGRQAEADQVLERWRVARDLDQATTDAEESVLDNPDDAAIWITLADHYLAAGRYGDALRSLNVANYLVPEDLRVRSDIANLHLVMGDTLSAARRFEAIVRQDSTFADAWLNLGVVYALQGDYPQAREAWLNVLKYNPSDTLVQTYLARLDE